MIVATVTPCSGYANSSNGHSCGSATDTLRTTVNSAIENTSPPYCPADFSTAVADPASVTSPPEKLLGAYDTGDHVNLTLGAAGGYAALAPAVTFSGCPLSPNSYPLPPP